MSYRIVIVDMFHAHDDDGSWPGGEFATLAEAISAAKVKIDRELKHLMEGQTSATAPTTAEGLVSRYRDYGEHPIVIDPDHRSAFDSWAYVRERAGSLHTG